MLEPALRNQLVEVMAKNLRSAEINKAGELILRKFAASDFTGTGDHITLSPRKCANILVEEADARGKMEELVKLVVELDDNVIQGRQVEMQGVEAFLSALARTGLVYDFAKRRLVHSKKDPSEMPNWGALKDDKTYDITVASVDIAKNSQLVKKHGAKTMEKAYHQLWQFLHATIEPYNGRIWSWAGDGGILAFAFKDHVSQAVRCSLEIQSKMPVFNMRAGRAFEQDISLRIGLDTGKIKFRGKTGEIVSEVVNYAAHLEKKAAEPGCVAISAELRNALDKKIAGAFVSAGVFEERKYFAVPGRLDVLPVAEPAQQSA